MPIYKLTLKPGQTLPQVIGGEFIQYVDGPAPLRIRKNGGSWDEYWIGTGTGREPFTSFEVENPSGFEVTIYLWVDSVEFIDRRRNQIEAPTEFDPVAEVAGVYVGGALLANQALDLSGNPPAGRVRRKAVQIFNLDPSSNLLLCSPSVDSVVVSGAGDALANGKYKLIAANVFTLNESYSIQLVSSGQFGIYYDNGSTPEVRYFQSTGGHTRPESGVWSAAPGYAPVPAVISALIPERVGGVVRPGETITQPVSGPLRVRNATGAPIACYLSEIWWTA